MCKAVPCITGHPTLLTWPCITAWRAELALYYRTPDLAEGRVGCFVMRAMGL
ncbi:MAG: hypothetical protein IJM58_08470 [Muribaculaceae bacterium]|nr:hypothetical protein [Muribaculaceae bacterium]